MNTLNLIFRMVVSVFVGGIWMFIVIAFALGLVKLIWQCGWRFVRWLSRPVRLRRRMASTLPVENQPAWMPDDATLDRWLAEAGQDDADGEEFCPLPPPNFYQTEAGFSIIGEALRQ